MSTIKPTKAQKKVFSLLAKADKPVAWLGTVRAGKTWGAVMHMLKQVQARPGIYVLGGYTYGSIERNLLPVFERVAEDWDMKITIKKSYPYRITLGEGTIFCLGASDESSQRAIQGMTVIGAVVDEAFLMPQSFIMQLVARMSESDPWLLLTGNKETPDHWLKRQWIDTGKCEVIETGLAENPHISAETKDWYGSLIVGAFADRMLGNEWRGPGNSICLVHEGPLPDLAEYSFRLVSFRIAARFIDRSAESMTAVVTLHRTQTENYLVVEDVGENLEIDSARTICNEVISRAAHVQAKPFDMARALSAFTIAFAPGIDPDLCSEFQSLYWIDRVKPSAMSSAVSAVALAAFFCYTSAGTTFAQPDFI